MEYLSDFSDHGLEEDENDERNKIPGRHEERLAVYQNGRVSTEEIDVLLTQLQGRQANMIDFKFSVFSV